MALQRAVYRPRDAEHTVLHQVIALHLEAFLEAVAEAGNGAGLPHLVEREFRVLAILLWHRLLGWPASESGRVWRGDRGHGRGHRRPLALMLALLLVCPEIGYSARKCACLPLLSSLADETF